MRVILNCRECGGSFKVSAFPPKPECPLCGASLEGHYACDGCNKKYTKETLDTYGQKKAITEEEAINNLVKIPGVGQLKGKTLYDAGFHSIFQIASSSLEELAKVEKIGKKSAKKIKAALEKEDLKALQEKEITKSLVEEELECPICSTILSVYDTQCYECGFNFGQKKKTTEDLKALTVYDRKLQVNPNDPDILFAKGATLARLERFEEALALYQTVSEVDPEFDGIWNAMAESYTATGNSDKAAECYKKSMQGALSDILSMSVGKEETELPTEEDKLLDMLLGLEDDIGVGPAEADVGLALEETLKTPGTPPATSPIATAPITAPADLEEDLEGMLDSLLEEMSIGEDEEEISTVQPDMLACPLCGNMVPYDATECSKCQAKFTVEEAAEPAPPVAAVEVAPVEAMEDEDILTDLEEIVEEESMKEEVPIEVENLPEEPSFITPEEEAEPTSGLVPLDLLLNVSEKKWFMPVTACFVVLLLIVGFIVAQPADPEDPVFAIGIDGNVDDWSQDSRYNDLLNEGMDPAGEIVDCGITADENNLYGFVRTQAPPFSSGAQSINWFIDSDSSSSTGYSVQGIGAEYMITAQGTAGLDNTHISRFLSGDPTNWDGWTSMREVKGEITGTSVEMGVSLAELGLAADDTPKSVFATARTDGVDYGPVIKLNGPASIFQQTISSPSFINPGETGLVGKITASSQNGDTLLSGLVLEISGTVDRNDGTIRLYRDLNADGNISVSDTLIASASSAPGKAGITIPGVFHLASTQTELLVGFEASVNAISGHGLSVSLISASTSNSSVTIVRDGTSLHFISDLPDTYAVDGDISEWTLQADPTSDSTGTVEIIASGAYLANGNIYACVQSDEKLLGSHQIPLIQTQLTGTKLTLYVDKDGNATGHYVAGEYADYKIELLGSNGILETASVYRFTGTASTHDTWRPVGVPEVAYHDTDLELSIPLGVMNIAPGDAVNLVWMLSGMGGSDTSSVMTL